HHGGGAPARPRRGVHQLSSGGRCFGSVPRLPCGRPTLLKGPSSMASTNKIALVTGAGSGIGKAAALALLNEGYAVTLAGRRKDALESVVREAKPGARTLIVPSDVGDPGSVRALFARHKEPFNRLDLLFNNPAIRPPAAPMEDPPLQQQNAPG